MALYSFGLSFFRPNDTHAGKGYHTSESISNKRAIAAIRTRVVLSIATLLVFAPTSLGKHLGSRGMQIRSQSVNFVKQVCDHDPETCMKGENTMPEENSQPSKPVPEKRPLSLSGVYCSQPLKACLVVGREARRLKELRHDRPLV